MGAVGCLVNNSSCSETPAPRRNHHIFML